MSSLTIQAQEIDADTLIHPLTTKGQSFENYLASLAWNNNPAYKVFASELKIAMTEVQIAKRAWADDWNITLNLNENNIETSNEVPQVSISPTTEQTLMDLNLDEVTNALQGSGQAISVNNFPRYNFGLTLNLGSLLTRGKEVDIAEERLKIEQFGEDQGKFELRAEVYQAYDEYLQSIKSLKIVAKQEQTSANIFDLMKSRFQSGTINFDDLNQSTQEYNRSLESLNNAEQEVAAAKLAIQALIGMPLKLAREYYEKNNME